MTHRNPKLCLNSDWFIIYVDPGKARGWGTRKPIGSLFPHFVTGRSNLTEAWLVLCPPHQFFIMRTDSLGLHASTSDKSSRGRVIKFRFAPHSPRALSLEASFVNPIVARFSFLSTVELLFYAIDHILCVTFSLARPTNFFNEAPYNNRRHAIDDT